MTRRIKKGTSARTKRERKGRKETEKISKDGIRRRKRKRSEISSARRISSATESKRRNRNRKKERDRETRRTETAPKTKIARDSVPRARREKESVHVRRSTL